MKLAAKDIFLFLILLFVVQVVLSQQIIAEFQSKNIQLDFQAIPFGDSILLSNEEIIGPNRHRVKQTKWITKDGKTSDLFCPVNVFAVESEGEKNYHYYRDNKSLKAFEIEKGSTTTAGVSESIEFNETILASYVDDNLFFILLSEDGMEISLLEIAGMKIVNTKKYKLPISLDEFINKNTYVEFYDEPTVDSFKGRARVKIFRYANSIALIIDEKQVQPTNKKPNVTHVLNLDVDGSVKHHTFPLTEKTDFGSYLFDNKLFQSVISKQKFSLTAFDLSTGKKLMKKEVMADSVDFGKKDSLKVNFRWGKENFQGWDTFKRTIKVSGSCDPLIVVSKNSDNYIIQWGTYFDEKASGTYTGATPLAALLTFFVTTAIRQVSEGPGMSRYLYYQTDLKTGKFLSVDSPSSDLLRGRIDEYERSRQTKNKSPFESKSYIPFAEGVVGIYRLKPEKMIGATQLVYFK